jgi:hypothetical protein
VAQKLVNGKAAAAASITRIKVEALSNNGKTFEQSAAADAFNIVDNLHREWSAVFE